MNTQQSLKVKKGFSIATDEQQAITEVFDAIHQEQTDVVLLFCSSKYHLGKLGTAIQAQFDVPVLACTTAGELGPSGYLQGSIVGVSLAGGALQVSSYGIHDLSDYKVEQVDKIASAVDTDLAHYRSQYPDAKGFGFLMIDGLSCMEETVIGSLYNALNNIPIIGGSAGDDLNFKTTAVYKDGSFHSDMAMFAFFATTQPFKIFKSQHFIPSNQKMVITKADPEKRIVHEINGYPAGTEYAHFVGLHIDKLSPQVFSQYPVLLKIGGEYYVRSIQKVNDDGSLTFFCAIDEGLVLTLSKGVDYMDTLTAMFERVRETIPQPKLIIGCECILRRLEVVEDGLVAEASRLMSKNHVLGFHTYGEQINAIHVNQTFTGIAL